MPQQVSTMLRGSIAAGNSVQNLVYQNNTLSAQGAVSGGQVLNQALQSAFGEKCIVMGHSLGAVAACWWLANKAPTSGLDPKNVSFILLGNMARPYGGYCYYINWFSNSINVTVPVNNPFPVIDFTRQYDGYADYPPGRPGPAAPVTIANAQAITNAYDGQISIHPAYNDVTLTDPQVVSFQAGNNVTYMWHTTWPAPILGDSMNIFTEYLDQAGRASLERSYTRPVTPPLPNYAGDYPVVPDGGNLVGHGSFRASMVCY